MSGRRRLHKGPAILDFSAAFDVRSTEDGQGIVWTLHFHLEQYHRFLDTTPDGAEREAVRELIATGLEMHHTVGVQPRATKPGPNSPT